MDNKPECNEVLCQFIKKMDLYSFIRRWWNVEHFTIDITIVWEIIQRISLYTVKS